MGFIFNFIKNIIKITIKLTLYVVIFATIITIIPNLPPYTKFTSIELAPTQERIGPLAPNNALNNAEKKYKGKLLGPEAFQLHNGELYTSLATGEIVKISPGGHITFVTKLGQPCSGLTHEHICGRPLGFQIDDKGEKMYVTDAYHGIWKVDLKTDKKQLLVSPRVEINQRQPKLFNSIALAGSGDFYWTDSSSDFQLKDGAMGLLVDSSGRLFYYNAAKNESTVLADDLWFANGLVLSPNKDFLVVAETGKYRLLKHYLTGPKKGNTEVFVDGLPGTPDNIRVLPDGSGVLVGLYAVFDDENPLIIRSLAATPAVRKFLARLQRLIEIPFEYFNSVYPHVIFEDVVYNIGHFKSFSKFTPPLSGILQIDWNGKIIASYFNTDSSLGHISDAIVFNDKLYTGNPHSQDFIGAVPVPPLLKEAFKSVKKSDAPKADAKPQQAKPAEIVKPKAEQKVEQPKAEPKVKIEEKTKVEQKPKLEEKKTAQNLNVDQKPKVETKPKVEEKKEAPKVAKPVESGKPTDTKPKAQTTTTTPPPTPTTPTSEPTKNVPQEQVKVTTPKPEVKTTPPPKPTTTPPSTTTPLPKTTTQKPDEPVKTQKPVKQGAPEPTQGKPKEQIPIKEEIPSDTAKPTKEKLKVIKKGGVPTEIPVPN